MLGGIFLFLYTEIKLAYQANAHMHVGGVKTVGSARAHRLLRLCVSSAVYECVCVFVCFRHQDRTGSLCSADRLHDQTGERNTHCRPVSLRSASLSSFFKLYPVFCQCGALKEHVT